MRAGAGQMGVGLSLWGGGLHRFVCRVRERRRLFLGRVEEQL